MLVSFNDAEAASRRMDSSLQRVGDVKGPAPVLDAARLAILCSHDVDQGSRRPALDLEVLLQSSGETAFPRRDGASSPVQDVPYYNDFAVARCGILSVA